jgi:phosphomevalonate kinase
MRRAVLATLTVVLALAAMASVAIGDPSESIEAYKTAVEPICKTNKEASKRILTGVEKLVKEDKLKPAGAKFAAAAKALEQAEKELAAVPQPPESAAKLGKWLSGVKGEVSLMKTIAAKFKAGNKSKGSSLVVKLKNNATKTNNLVLSFRFNYCKINPSQFH